MISEAIIKKFIKDSENVENEEVRNKYGTVAGIVGIVSNLLLFILKFSIGFLSGSIAITADAFNNFTDMASSAITMIGFKLASMPADEEHPFGHGRLEYLSALVVAFMVMFVGIKFVQTSFERIMNPVAVQFSLIPFILLLCSMAVKFWLGRFNKIVGEKIDSSALKAVAVDAMGDVFTSGCVVLSYLIAKFTAFPLDGYVGIVVSLIILYAGFSLIKETVSPLLGEAPDAEMVDAIVNGLLEYNIISGVHDLIIHNYGVGRCIASVHAEVPCNIDIMEIHEVIDDAEKELSKKLNIHLVIHMDPIAVEDEDYIQTRTELARIIARNEKIESMHDLRIVGKGDKKNLVFDVVVDGDLSHSEEEELKNWVNDEIQKIHPNYNCVILVDKNYVKRHF
ncbi:cation diffusion facilitator family transporter [Peptacetobacter hiranonis]|uniref:cation diffusion facilitator family transporter n=1 Tax=Peptacetobacter hiranonis TaxID=89152 RepID=UPI0002DEA3DA|nr:cation diffusion facilitator family transporter [Peptacetobacter hiranonis]MED9947161.1 cation diffusion facilitator family transporter [Peptacetobacter hiranonis]QEK20190.1 Ferrous-iron efflux pump FieF [Peptacetobacter hiranonis]